MICVYLRPPTLAHICVHLWLLSRGLFEDELAFGVKAFEAVGAGFGDREFLGQRDEQVHEAVEVGDGNELAGARGP